MSATGAGPQVPGTAVNTEPTFAVPVIVGTGAGDKATATTAAVTAEVFFTVVYPAFDPVTVTVTVFPTRRP